MSSSSQTRKRGCGEGTGGTKKCTVRVDPRGSSVNDLESFRRKPNIENGLKFSIFNFQSVRLPSKTEKKPCHGLQHCRSSKIVGEPHFSLHRCTDSIFYKKNRIKTVKKKKIKKESICHFNIFYDKKS